MILQLIIVVFVGLWNVVVVNASESAYYVNFNVKKDSISITRSIVEIFLKKNDTMSNKISSQVISILEEAVGPYAFEISVKWNGISWKGKENEIIQVLIFDDPVVAYQPVQVSYALLLSPFELKKWICERYKTQVKFALSPVYPYPLEIKWIHFCGNSKIVSLGNEGRPWILAPGQIFIQDTHAGHFFALMEWTSDRIDCEDSMRCKIRDESNIDVDMNEGLYDNSNIEFDQHFEFHRIKGVIFVPAINKENIHYTISLGNEGCSQGNAAKYRDIIFRYWEYQRLASVNIQFWMIPSLPITSNDCSTEDTCIVNYEDKIKSTRSLWTKFSLPQTIADKLKNNYLSIRDNPNYNNPEPPISMVFNQHSVNTRYVPLTTVNMNELSEYILNQSSTWLNMTQSELFVTSNYGCREYSNGAVIRWHVDPVSPQPITAIIHIADDGKPRDSSVTKFKESSAWGIEIPKYLPYISNFVQFQSTTGQEMIQALTSEEIETIHLQEGEVLLLQSAKLPHARLKPYVRGSYYANAFVHIAPIGWESRNDVTSMR